MHNFVAVFVCLILCLFDCFCCFGLFLGCFVVCLGLLLFFGGGGGGLHRYSLIRLIAMTKKGCNNNKMSTP